MLLKFLSSLFTARAAFGASVRDCSSPTALFKLNSVGLEPANPALGSTISLSLDYTVPEGLTVTDGTTTYAITLNFIPFQPSINPLCQDIPCPLGPGTYSNITQSMWPSGVSGSFTSKMTWTDQDTAELLCIQISGTLDQSKPLTHYLRKSAAADSRDEL